MEVGGRPVLGHVMEIYARQGFTDFVLAAGFKVELDRRVRRDAAAAEWKVEVFDTGVDTNTGGRVAACARHHGRDVLRDLRRRRWATSTCAPCSHFHRAHGGAATLTTVPLPSQYGTSSPTTRGGWTRFLEKPRLRRPLHQRRLLRARPAGRALVRRGRTSSAQFLPALAARGRARGLSPRRLLESMDTYKDALGAHRVVRRAASPPGTPRRGAPDPRAGGPGGPGAAGSHRGGTAMSGHDRLPPDAAASSSRVRPGSSARTSCAGSLADGVEVHGLTSTVSSVYAAAPGGRPRPHHPARGQPGRSQRHGRPGGRGAPHATSFTSAPTPTSASPGTGSTSACRPTCRARSTSSRPLTAAATHASSTWARARSTATSRSPFQEDQPVRPVSPYAASKYAAERFCRVFVTRAGAGPS